MKSDLDIRLETPEDYDEVEQITRAAFWNHHVPGCDEHYLAHTLRQSACFLPELDFVATLHGRMVGNILYTRAVIREGNGANYPVLSFGPVSVLPEFQGKGIGSALIRHSLAVAKQAGDSAVLIYGDPEFYKRFGFVSAERYGIGTRDDDYHIALQALELQEGALANRSGRFFEDEAYEVDAKAAEKFDARFPPKERLSGLPSQIRFLELVKMRRPRR